MRFGIERNIITKQTVMNEAVDGETARGAAGGVRLLRRRRGGRENRGAPRCHFLLSRQAILASSLQCTQRNLKGHCTVGFIPGQRERSWGGGVGGCLLLCVCRERRSVNLDVASVASTPQSEVLNPRFRGKSTLVTCFFAGLELPTWGL